MPRNDVVFRPVASSVGGWVRVNPLFAAGFVALGIDSAAGFLELPGEVVCGHPDRHVMRVVLPGQPTAFYLKRQHSVTWRERLRNRLLGFGWSSRCVREAAILKELMANSLPAPRWVAVGEDARGRSFLLVEEVAKSCDLREVLSNNALSLVARRDLANRLGHLIARLHNAGLTTPDLTAKHLLVSRQRGEITPIDWQSARRMQPVPLAERIHALAALHASVAEELASPRERLRVLRAALQNFSTPSRSLSLTSPLVGEVAPSLRGAGGRYASGDPVATPPTGSQSLATSPIRGEGKITLTHLAKQIEHAARKIRGRRSIRDQRQPVVTASAQRLVWLAEEAVCAVPAVAAIWPKPAVAAPFYGCEPGTLRVKLAGGRDAVLIRGRSFSPLSRLKAKLQGRSWRSPGVTLGRLLFHLERYGVPAPRLFAFGQRLTNFASAEWFALHETAGEPIGGEIETATAEQLGRTLRQLHDAGCRPIGPVLAAFGATQGAVSVRDVTKVRLARKVSSADRQRDLARLLAALSVEGHSAVEAGYQLTQSSSERSRRDLALRVADGPISGV
ncbi:MAG: lipopolysaccharide kinase InaA family protein [Planctomycetes bacterium]|nr:lipopolysaccharide kinase InaA family protein [Planctomycetota bacterium]